MDQEGGTSESSPLTAGAAADVISAYRATHGGHSPSPALVKKILVSTASDIVAPAEQQGAGLLNVGAAINLATTDQPRSSKPSSKHELTFSTNQINITGNTKSNRNSENRDHQQRQDFCEGEALDADPDQERREVDRQRLSEPDHRTIACGPPTANTFLRENGLTQVYVEQRLTSRGQGRTRGSSFSAALPFQDTNFSVLKVALYAPNGAYAGYSIPQGVSNYANIQVASPQAGKWTAVFFDTKNDSAPAGHRQVGSRHVEVRERRDHLAGARSRIAPGHYDVRDYKVKLPSTPGDTSQSIVVNSGNGTTNTIPVTIRTRATPSTTFSRRPDGRQRARQPGRDEHLCVQGAHWQEGHRRERGLRRHQRRRSLRSSRTRRATTSPSRRTCIRARSLSNTVTVYNDHPQAGTWTLVSTGCSRSRARRSTRRSSQGSTSTG